MSRPHVAFAITGLHNQAGGAERVLVNVANGLHRRGYRVSIITYQDRSGPSFYPLDFGIARYDCKTGTGRSLEAWLQKVSPRSRSRRHRPRQIAAWLMLYGPKIRAFRKMLKLIQPDVVIAFMPSSFPYMTLAAKGTGAKVIASVHNVPYRELGGDPRRWDQNPVDIAIRRRSLEWADAVTVLLPSFRNELTADVRAHTFVVPNMLQGFGNLTADVATGRDNVIVAVGRLAAAKDHETLIRAWAMIEDRYPLWRVEIYGRGPLLEHLRRVRRELDVQRVSLEAPTNEIESVYARSKFLAMPSIHEGFGLVTVEAMACGLPVVGFADCAGTNEIILAGENGLLVDPGDDRVRAYADALSDLIEDEELRVALAISAPATTKRFDPDEVLEQWEGLLEKTTKPLSVTHG